MPSNATIVQILYTPDSAIFSLVSCGVLTRIYVYLLLKSWAGNAILRGKLFGEEPFTFSGLHDYKRRTPC